MGEWACAAPMLFRYLKDFAFCPYPYHSKDSQCDDHCRLNPLNGSSCSACNMGENKAHPDPYSIGYTVDLKNITGNGFPWEHDYTKCTAFNRHEVDCTYWPSALFSL
jgi:hypothetical protein